MPHSKKPFNSILVANRGEIAVRVMQTAKRMGLRTIAVYSEADTNALHVKYADDAVFVGPSPSSQSYLNIDSILAAIDQSGAQAVHPGYGFLSEKDYFAAAVAKTGAVFIGPSPDAIHKMGDKIESKKIARAAGVSTVPGVVDAVTSESEARDVVKKIGYPVMIKAAAGGGGKGMRIARDEKQLLEGLRLAASEAASSFNDARVFIEKYFDNPRHIEIQILGDKHGNVVALGERECSIQRRHQKVIEEAPSPFVNDKMRKQMSEQSIALAKEVGYYSAGTVEFIVDQNTGKFYFLEMNTRLQVEHRVTELVTGLDLVEQMIRIAQGEKLSFKQSEVAINGWAFEARVYAEDPSRGFLPSTGRIVRYEEPKARPGLVVDTSVYEGGEVSMFYDPMIAKISVHGETRDAAIESMRGALKDMIIMGVSHNIGFLDAVMDHERFRKGDLSTRFIEQEYPAGFSGARLDSESTKVFMATVVMISLRDVERASQTTGQLPGRSRAIGARWVVTIAGSNYPVYVRKRDGGYDIGYDEGEVVVRSQWKLGRRLFQGTVNGRPVSVRIQPMAEGYMLAFGGAEVKATMRSTRVAELAKYMPTRNAHETQYQLKAPIAGLISKLMVEEGQRVAQGQELYVIEAMKMENIIFADHDVVVKKIHITAPCSVTADQLIIEFEAGTA